MISPISYSAPHRSPSTVERDLQQARTELQLAPRFNLQLLRDRVQQLTTQAVIDPDKWRADLLLAQHQLDAAHQEIARKHGLTQRIAELEQEHQEAIRLDEVDRRERASKRMGKAMNEFRIAAMQAGRAYQSLVIAHRNAGSTTALPSFHSSTLVPRSWQGMASDILQQNVNGLPALNDDQEVA